MITEGLTSRLSLWDTSSDTINEDVVRTLINNVSSIAKDFIMEHNVNNFKIDGAALHSRLDTHHYCTVVELSVLLKYDEGRDTWITSRLFVE